MSHFQETMLYEVKSLRKNMAISRTLYYACTMSTISVLCLLCLYYVYYACTMPTMIVLCLLCLLCLFITTDTLLMEQDIATVKDGLNISSERFSKSFVVLSTKLHHIGFYW